MAGEGAPLGGDNEAVADAEKNCSEPVEFDEAVVLEVGAADGCAGIRALVVVPRITTGLDGRRGGGSISVVMLGEDGGVVLLSEDGGVVLLGEDGGVVVPDDCRSSVSLR